MALRGTDLDGGPDDTRRLLRRFCDDPLGWSGPDVGWGDARMLHAATVTQQLATPPWH